MITFGLPVMLYSWVLYPIYLRNTLLCTAEAGLYQVCWTDEILAGAFRNLVKDGRMNKIQADRLNQIMNRAFPKALIALLIAVLPMAPTNISLRTKTLIGPYSSR